MCAEAPSSEGWTQAGGSTSKLTHLAVGPSQVDLTEEGRGEAYLRL